MQRCLREFGLALVPACCRSRRRRLWLVRRRSRGCGRGTRRRPRRSARRTPSRLWRWQRTVLRHLKRNAPPSVLDRQMVQFRGESLKMFMENKKKPLTRLRQTGTCPPKKSKKINASKATFFMKIGAHRRKTQFTVLNSCLDVTLNTLVRLISMEIKISPV